MPTPNTYAEDRNMIDIEADTLPAGAGPYDRMIAVKPSMRTSIVVKKGGETAQIQVTNSRTTNLDDALWADVNNDTNDYAAGDSFGITGVRIIANPAAQPIEYSIKQCLQAVQI